MTKMKAMLAVAALSLGTFAGSAVAQTAHIQNVQWGYNNGAYEKGLRDGSNSGRQDAEKGKGYIPYEHGSYHDHNDQAYREGFLRGYGSSFRQYQGARGGYYGGYPNGYYGGYPSGYYGYPAGPVYRDGYYRDGYRNRDWDRDHDRYRRDRDWDHDRYRHDRDRDRDRDHDRDHDHDWR